MRILALTLALLAAAPLSLAAAQDAAVPPVMVVVVSSGHVDEALRVAVQTALVDGVGPMAGGRPVLPLAQEDLRARFVACTDAACQGAFVAELGAVGAVVARISRTGARGAVHASVDVIDPVRGASRLAQLALTLDGVDGVAPALAPVLEQLRPVMFSPPPPPPMLLVTVNVDGATVMIDEVAVGSSPIAAQRLTPGHHTLRVTRDGYAGTQRELDLEPGEQARLDINLSLLEGIAVVADTSPSFAGAAAEPQWYEQWYVWVGVAAGVLVVTGVIVGAVLASQPVAQPDPMGIPLPGLRF